MLTGIHIRHLRGVHDGRIDRLAPLTILVGPSGAGKSTVLDAMLIATSGSPGDAIGRVVRRRSELLQGVPWLFERQTAQATISLEGDESVARTCALSWTTEPSEDLVANLKPKERVRKPTEIVCDVTSRYGRFRSRTVVTVMNSYRFDLHRLEPSSETMAAFQRALDVRLIEVQAGANHEPLHRPFSKAAEQGRLAAIDAMLPSVLDGAIGLKVLTVEDTPRDQPVLHIAFADHTIPVAGAGAGIYALVRLAIELAALPHGIALVEEPEVHQHPAALRQTAKLLHATARRGVQTVVSTHSLDLVDMLLAEAQGSDLEGMAVIRITLEKGALHATHFTGSMVAAARGAIHQDLR